MYEQQCSKYFKYKDFIECGETQHQTGIKNYPLDYRTFHSIEQLAVTILDPVVDQFGQIKLTYGFCSNELLLQIKKKHNPGISPQIDQHSGYERNSRNTYICKRAGFACDFYAVNTDSLAVAKWVIENLSFDRFYYYGKSRPIHISIGPEMNSAITILETLPNGRRMPRNLKKEKFFLRQE